MGAITQLKMEELANDRRMHALKAGLASVVPLQLLTLTSPSDLELRTCGLPTVNIEFLKVWFNQFSPEILLLADS